MKAICDQSKVKIPIPSPVDVPKSVLTTTFFGAIQHTQLKTLKAVKRYPGNQYQAKLANNAMRKNRSRVIWPRSRLPKFLWRVLKRAELTRAPGQIMLAGQTTNWRSIPPREKPMICVDRARRT